MSVKEALSKFDWRSETTLDQLIEWQFWDQEFAGDMSEASAFQNLVDEYAIETFGDEERYVTDSRGYAQIFELMT
jgi:hypothetical protein